MANKVIINPSDSNQVTVRQGESKVIIVNTQGPQGPQGPPGEGTGNIDSSSFVLNSQTSSFVLNGQLGAFATTASNQFSGSQYITGSIFFSGGSQLIQGINGSNNTIDLLSGPSGWARLTSYNTQSFIWVSNNGAYIGTNWDSTAYQWIFANTGILTAPGGIIATSFTGSFSGSLYGTSSWAESSSISISSSYALTASYALNGGGTTINTSALATTGSNNFNGNQIVTGSIYVTAGITGSLFGTASWAESASYALTASYVLSSSYALTASYASSSNYASTANVASTANTLLVYPFTSNEISDTSYFPIVKAETGNDPQQGINKLVYDNSLLIYSKSLNTYIFSNNDVLEIPPTINIGIEHSPWGGANLNVYGNILATGSVTTATLNTSLGTLNFVSDIQRASESIQASLSVTNGTLLLTGVSYSGSFIGNLTGTASYATTASYYNETDPIFRSKSGSFATTGSNQFNGNQVITGSLTITQNLIVLGSSSITYLTASQLAVSMSYISVNVFEPQQQFGGFYVYDSGSSFASASLTWDSFNNRWIYTNQNGASYSGGGLISGPRNTGSIGQETYPTQNVIVKGQGGDHIMDSNITDTGTVVSINSNTQITGSLSTTDGVSVNSLTASFISASSITGSLFGTASWSSNTITAQTASYLLGAVTSASFAATASLAPNYVLNSSTSSFIQNSQTSSLLAPYMLISSTSSMSVLTASYATFAASSSYIEVTDTTTGTGPYYVLFVSMSSGFRIPRVDSNGLLYNATTNLLSTTASVSLTSSYVNNLNQTVTVTGSVLGNVSALSISSNTASLNLSTANFFTLQLVAGTNTYINPTNLSSGQTVNILLSTTGSATVSFPSLVKQPSGSTYVPSTSTGKDVITMVTFDSTAVYLSYVKNLL